MSSGSFHSPTSTLPSLTPVMSLWMQQLAAKPEVLQQLMDIHSSPLNIHFLPPFSKNYEAYRQVFESFGLDHLVLFARKANKCRFFVKEACHQGFGVDTASYRELQEALELDCPSDRLVCTAAVKSTPLLQLAIKEQVAIILDNEDEFQQVLELSRSMNKQARIGFRLSGFWIDGEKCYSRFGFDVDSFLPWIKQHQDTFLSNNCLSYVGLHFHLNGYSIHQRGVALSQTLQMAEKLQKTNGLITQFIDIGGGFLMNYLSSKGEWLHFQEVLKAAVLEKRPPITFRNAGLGFELIDGRIAGCLQTYPYYNELHKDKALAQVLEYAPEGERSNAQALKERGIQLRIEPGRSLLDQAGITVARVAFRKRDSDGNWLIGLEMNMTQLCSSSTDFLLDPIVLYQNAPVEPTLVEAYFTGAYCLERDVILKRKISLKQLPAIGDMVMFVNTAGYMMHFFESEAHLFNLATNLLLLSTSSPIDSTSFLEDKSLILSELT